MRVQIPPRVPERSARGEQAVLKTVAAMQMAGGSNPQRSSKATRRRTVRINRDGPGFIRLADGGGSRIRNHIGRAPEAGESPKLASEGSTPSRPANDIDRGAGRCIRGYQSPVRVRPCPRSGHVAQRLERFLCAFVRVAIVECFVVRRGPDAEGYRNPPVAGSNPAVRGGDSERVAQW
jgi:hypothetical protein